MPEELNGSLTRSGCPGGLILSENKAQAIEQEAAAVRQKVTGMLKAYMARWGQGSEQVTPIG